MDTTPTPDRIAVVGAGRLGSSLAAALRDAGRDVDGPLGRGATGEGATVVLLCVPDAEIAAAACAVRARAGLLVGHCSGASALGPLGAHEGFSLHPLMTIPATGARFAGATVAVAGATPRALAAAEELADALGMAPVEVADDDRAAYHAAASIASNFLVALEDVAERLAATAGVPRARLVPLVHASVEAWAAHGGPRALTGPIARGDDETVARQRQAVAERAPEDLPLFDALADATRRLASRSEASGWRRPPRGGESVPPTQGSISA